MTVRVVREAGSVRVLDEVRAEMRVREVAEAGDHVLVNGTPWRPMGVYDPPPGDPDALRRFEVGHRALGFTAGSTCEWSTTQPSPPPQRGAGDGRLWPAGGGRHAGLLGGAVGLRCPERRRGRDQGAAAAQAGLRTVTGGILLHEDAPLAALHAALEEVVRPFLVSEVYWLPVPFEDLIDLYLKRKAGDTSVQATSEDVAVWRRGSGRALTGRLKHWVRETIREVDDSGAAGLVFHGFPASRPTEFPVPVDGELCTLRLDPDEFWDEELRLAVRDFAR